MSRNLMEEAAKIIIENEQVIQMTDPVKYRVNLIEKYRVNFIVEPIKGGTDGQKIIRISLGPFFETGPMSKVLENLLKDTGIGVIDRSSGIPYTNSVSFISKEVLYEEYKNGEEKIREEEKIKIENVVRELLTFLIDFVDAFSKAIQSNKS
jgi:hypothetical protein